MVKIGFFSGNKKEIGDETFFQHFWIL